ncbi:MAG: LamG domain-containing protein [Phycisphaeraceae bacterium]|nr:LamG domain-containing protein [Phycisphaeraceae bacterium]
MTLIKHVDFEVPDFGELTAGPATRPGHIQAVQALNPLAYWRMGDAAPGPLKDLVAGNHATIVGTINLQQGGLLFGDSDECADFAGGRAEIGAPAVLTGLTAFTLGGIFSADSLPVSSGISMAMTQANFSTSGNKWTLWLAGSDSSRLAFTLYNSTNTAFATRSTFTPTPGTIYHIFITYDDAGDRKCRIYVNGAEVSYSAQPALTGTLKDGSAISLCIGDVTGFFAGSGFVWDGKIDEVAVFGAALSGSQVKSLYQIGAGILEA